MKTSLVLLTCVIVTISVFGCKKKELPPQTEQPAQQMQSLDNKADSNEAKPADEVSKSSPQAAKEMEKMVEEQNVPTTPPVQAGTDAVVATVDGHPIMQSRVMEMIEPQLKKLEAQAQMPAQLKEQYKMQMLKEAADSAIVEYLLDKQVASDNIVITDAQAEAEILKKIAEQNMSIDDLKALLAAQGQSYESVQQRVKKGLGYQQIFDEQMTGKVDVNEQDAREFYDKNIDQFSTPEQVRASHILIISDPNKDPNTAKADAKAEAEKLLAKIKNEGANFEELAKEFSKCPSSAKGGDLGYFEKGKMVPAFEQAAFAMEPNQVSDVVETQFGYHIIKTTGKKAAETQSFEETKDQIIEHLTQQKKNELAKEYVESLKKSAQIVYPQQKAAEDVNEPAAEVEKTPQPVQPDANE